MQKKKCLTIVLDLTDAAVKTAFDEATSPVGAARGETRQRRSGERFHAD